MSEERTSGTMVVERVYSVDVEMADGTRTVLRLHAGKPSEAFRQARDMPGVRRVGRVTEGARHSDGAPARSPERQPRSVGSEHHSKRAAEPATSAERESSLGFSISGPRVVRDTRPTGGERPFAHLQPPPPRPEPVRPPKPPKPSVRQLGQPQIQRDEVPAVTPPEQEVTEELGLREASGAAAADSTAADRDYRILKSRRRDGLPYLLQWGAWRMQGGKRVFEIVWEKGFASREQADQHQVWREQMRSEMAELNA